MRELRRLVSGHDSTGSAMLVSDQMLAAQPLAGKAGWSWFDIWGTDEPMRFPDSGARPPARGGYPPIGGSRFMVYVVAPNTPAGYDPPAGQDVDTRATRAKSGLHRSATLDMVYVVEGANLMELDRGEQIRIDAGATLIQCGTVHSWSNPFDVRCVMLGVAVGAFNALTREESS